MIALACFCNADKKKDKKKTALSSEPSAENGTSPTRINGHTGPRKLLGPDNSRTLQGVVNLSNRETSKRTLKRTWKLIEYLNNGDQISTSSDGVNNEHNDRMIDYVCDEANYPNTSEEAMTLDMDVTNISDDFTRESNHPECSTFEPAVTRRTLRAMANLNNRDASKRKVKPTWKLNEYLGIEGPRKSGDHLNETLTRKVDDDDTAKRPYNTLDEMTLEMDVIVKTDVTSGTMCSDFDGLERNATDTCLDTNDIISAKASMDIPIKQEVVIKQENLTDLDYVNYNLGNKNIEFENEKVETGSLPVVVVKQEDGRVIKVIEQSLSGTHGSIAGSEISSTNVMTQHIKKENVC